MVAGHRQNCTRHLPMLVVEQVASTERNLYFYLRFNGNLYTFNIDGYVTEVRGGHLTNEAF